MKAELRKARDWLHAAEHICVLSHTSPDGDAVGSVLGLMWALRAAGKRVSPALPDKVPSTFTFLPGSAEVAQQVPADADLLVALDTADLERAGSLSRDLARPIDINIDHHISNSGFGRINLVASNTTATAEYLVGLLQAFGLALDGQVANCLLTGLVTDSLGFRTNSTGSATLATARKLLQYGGKLHEIYERTLHRRSFEAVKLWGQALGVARCEDGLAWTQVTLAGKAEIGYTAIGDADVISQLTAIEGAEVAVVFVERPDAEVKISWRSVSGLDVAAIAQHFGGGGHQAAAGANIHGATLVQAERDVLKRTRAALRHHRQNGSRQ
ncbi:MAG TPA: DHH family phosphoesterase [Anaerolineales bacterium]|jgi:phosphoesterase RecJ-like protein|nr:DHH family phosphoesterase [Anaerolineales bacterium]|tara:strand:- start:750 stop:1730 length:981 start_codon:yes stop_codon:yes gene_type:complete